MGGRDGDGDRSMTGPMGGRDGDEDRSMTRPMSGRDGDEDEERSRSGDDRENDQGMRRPPMFCVELVCGPEDRESCQEFKFEDGRPQRAFCISFGKLHLVV